MEYLHGAGCWQRAHGVPAWCRLLAEGTWVPAWCRLLAERHMGIHAWCRLLAERHMAVHAWCRLLAERHMAVHAWCKLLVGQYVGTPEWCRLAMVWLVWRCFFYITMNMQCILTYFRKRVVHRSTLEYDLTPNKSKKTGMCILYVIICASYNRMRYEF